MKNEYGFADVYLEEEDFIDESGEMDSKSYALIDYIEVSEEYRKQGYGREILMAAIKEAKEINDTVKIIAHEYDSDVIGIDELVRFYESCGFKVEDALENGNVLMEM